MLRRWAVVVALAFVGCESLRKPEQNQDPSPAAKRRDLAPSERGEVKNHRASVELPEAGNRPHLAPLPRGEVAVSASDTAGEGASAFSDPSPNPLPATERGLSPPSLAGKGVGGLGSSDPLALAAECLERGDRATAATHLEAHVQLHPEQLMFRVQLAELLVRLGRDDQARLHFERFADDARRANAAAKDQLVHVHTRLMEIGQRRRDGFAEVYHRGVGLLLLLAEEDANPARDAAFCEEMVCKAVKTLAEAKELKSGEACVRVYLAEAYERTGNRRAAEAERAAARTSMVPGGAGLMLPR